MSSKCNLCGGEILLGEGGVQAITHKETCAQAIEVEWVGEDGSYPDVPGVARDVHAEVEDLE